MPDHNSIESCRRNWTGGEERPPAGQAMSKALRAVGLTVNPRFGSTVSVTTQPHDSYWVIVPPMRVPEMVAELWKDDRVVTVAVDGEDRKKPEVAKTAEEIQQEFDAFKKQVVIVAMTKAKKHDWCEVVKDALTEMGLEVPKSKLRVVLEIETEDDDLSQREAMNLIYDLNRDDLTDAMKSFELVEE